jgi:hypothetical protein
LCCGIHRPQPLSSNSKIQIPYYPALLRFLVRKNEIDSLLIAVTEALL